MSLDDQYVEMLKSDLGADFDFVFKIWKLYTQSDRIIKIPKKTSPKDTILGKCDETEKALLACLCFTGEMGDDKSKARLMEIFLSKVSQRFKIKMEESIKIRKDFFIVISPY